MLFHYVQYLMRAAKLQRKRMLRAETKSDQTSPASEAGRSGHSEYQAVSQPGSQASATNAATVMAGSSDANGDVTTPADSADRNNINNQNN